MPLYEYRCLDCGENVEVIQKLSDAPLTQCEYCGGTLEKLLSAPAIQFKGSGWYITDYARKNGAGSSGSNGSDKNATNSSKDKDSGKESAAPASDTKTSSAK